MTEEKDEGQKGTGEKKTEGVESKPERGKGARKGKPDKMGYPNKVKDGFRHRVRVLRVIIDGNLDIQRALMNIKGIGQHISEVITKELSIDKKTKIGSLTDKEIERIENAVKNLQNSAPGWIVNRQRDPYSGKNMHVVGPDLELTHREDINLQKKLKSYIGIRHALGLPVRGQRTRTSFRKGATMGVSRKKAQPQTKNKDGGKK